jgi:hypothetical protein
MKSPALAISGATLTTLAMLRLAAAQTVPAISLAISTPDKVETRLGTLDFKDGMPSPAIMTRSTQSGLLARLRGVREHHAGREHGCCPQRPSRRRPEGQRGLVLSTLMDAKSLFLTANADTIYFFGFIDLGKGPMVLKINAPGPPLT